MGIRLLVEANMGVVGRGEYGEGKYMVSER